MVALASRRPGQSFGGPALKPLFIFLSGVMCGAVSSGCQRGDGSRGRQAAAGRHR